MKLRALKLCALVHLLCGAALLSCVLPASASFTISTGVPLNVPSAQYPTIQSGVDAAHDGDTVLVADGTFSGPGNRDIDFHGKSLTVTSQNGPSKTIIDCGGYKTTDGSGSHRGFYIHSGEKNATISGFTVKNGYEADGAGPLTDRGGGICIINLSGTTTATTLDNCIITTSTALFGGVSVNLFL